MGRPARKHPTRRLSLELHQDVRDQLERIRGETRADSITEVIRRAVAVYDFVLSDRLVSKKTGREVVILG